jgi:phosphoribosylformimino-5-aminoimidazole carboxamide ribotide isomerase
MIVIPAVDLLGGRTVRLRRGRRDEATEYGDPVEAARRWAEAGAARLHVVDLDGAFRAPGAGPGPNADAIRRVVAAAKEAGAEVEVAGGLRTPETVAAALAAGAAYAIVGTLAIENPDAAAACLVAHPGRVYVAVDAAGGVALGRGWTGGPVAEPLDLASWAETHGARGVVFTSIERDGTLEGPNLGALQRVLDAVSCRVVASGGVASLADVEAIRRLADEAPHLEGLIVGRAIYEGRLDLADAIRAAA